MFADHDVKPGAHSVPGKIRSHRRAPGHLFERGASVPGVSAGIAAYRGGGQRVEDVVGYLDGSRRLLAALLAEHLPGIGHQSPEGTYLDWLDCRDLFRDRGIETSPPSSSWPRPGCC